MGFKLVAFAVSCLLAATKAVQRAMQVLREKGSTQAIVAEMRAGGLDALSTQRDGRFSLASFVGSVKEFFLGRATTGLGTANAPTPKLVSSGRTEHRGATSLLCNARPRLMNSGGSILDHACSTDLSTTEYASEICR